MQKPRHALDQAGAEVVERDGHFHVLVGLVGVTVAQQHDLVVVAKEVVGYGDGGRGADDVDEPVGARRQRVVVDPNRVRPEDANGVAIRASPVANVCGRAPHAPGLPGCAMMNIDPMYDDVGDVLESEARPVRDLDVGAAPVEGFVASEDELILEHDAHVFGEVDPKGPELDHAVAEGPGGRVLGVVAVVGDHVVLSGFPARRAAPEPDRAIRERHAVLRPVLVASPTLIYAAKKNHRNIHIYVKPSLFLKSR